MWAIEVCKEYGKPVVASMRIGPDGDRGGNSPGKCAVEMAKAGTLEHACYCYRGIVFILQKELTWLDRIATLTIRRHYRP